MNRPKFAGLSATVSRREPVEAVQAASSPPDDTEVQPARSNAQRTKGREGKRAVAGYFSAELSRRLRTLAAEEETTVQALMGEAFDLLMRDRGKHPPGER